ncbi:hypothetical protein [Sphingomonas psychrotolerans]|uniref:Uncharacterized protein n=1 Tax=Sphingomonas psychrotolerans TaxID=1327635 RepID=A0A2K8MK09_9SPHN|nr:hypothetical protein [Sphingomonas psychrotolerans]ATY34185.1 hypothetical protein CVN68_21340 [Sphingomonas psychrotolerans]
MKRYIIAAAALILTAAVPALAQTGRAMNPAQAIAATAAAGSGTVEGVFEMHVASVGESGFNVYLNSSADYRDAANLSVELHPGALAELKARLGGEARELLAGKHIRIKGVARRVPIPRRDGTSYHQTRIDVDLASQIEIVG